jgi:hypothetical protein
MAGDKMGVTRTSTRIVKAVAISLVLLPCGFCGWMYGWFEFLHYQERQAYARWDAMNEALISEFGPPEGAEEIERETSGGLNRHGRWLYVDYFEKLEGNEEIIGYYDNLLQTNGWKLFSQTTGEYYWYFQDASCMVFAYHPKLSRYSIYIWQDYSSSSFSPRLPPAWLLNIFDVWETDIAICPPK